MVLNEVILWLYVQMTDMPVSCDKHLEHFCGNGYPHSTSAPVICMVAKVALGQVFL
jgi:hypothetical protein